MTGGRAPDGARVLSADSVAAMAEFQTDVPDKYVLGDSWGLGWTRFDWGGHELIGHDGNTIGQAAYLRVLPEAGLAVVLLTNGGHARDLYQDLYREIFAEIAQVEMAAPVEPPARPAAADVTPYLGAYERAGMRIEVLAGGGVPVLRTTDAGPLARIAADPVAEYPMTALGPGVYAVREPGTLTWLPVTFYELPSGEKYVHFAARATPKAGQEPHGG